MQRVVKLFTLPKDARKDTITALDCRENVVFVGTSGGLMQKWRLDQDIAKEDYVSRQLNQVQLKKKPVLQMIVDPTWPRIFTLCDENVSVHSTDNLSTVFYITDGESGRTQPLKGCSCIAIAPVHKGTHRICVATKRKLHLYTYKLAENSHHLFQVLVMPSAVHCLAFQGETLCCGYHKEYSLLNCYSGEATGLFSLANNQPHIKSLDTEHAALCRSANMSIKVSLKDADIKNFNPAIKNDTIVWSAEPRAIGFKHPYVVGLLPNSVEVYSMYEGEIVQALTNLSGAILACSKCPGTKDNLCIATAKDVYMLVSASIETQVKNLVESLKTTEAFELLHKNSTGNELQDQKRLKQTHIDIGFAYLFRGQPESAFEHFAATNIDVREVLAHFPDLLPANAREEGCVLHNWEASEPSNDVSIELEERYMMLNTPQNDDVSRISIDSSAMRSSSVADVNFDFALVPSKLMAKTIDMVYLFMSSRRESCDEVQQRCIDYASLVVSITKGDKKLSYELLSNTNYLDLQDCVPKLEEMQLYRELALLYYYKGMYDLASVSLDRADSIRGFASMAELPCREKTKEAVAVDVGEVFMAIESKDAGYLKKLLKADPETVNVRDSMGNTPLHYAVSNEQGYCTVKMFASDEQVALLGTLMSCGADSSLVNAYGLTALDVAKMTSHKTWGLLKATLEISALYALQLHSRPIPTSGAHKQASLSASPSLGNSCLTDPAMSRSVPSSGSASPQTT
eukprot:TRINITY_DN2235_c0_g3_i1.p1 TRINITY_DN2235_c0_g3~~TRINITY_DN2235_c0_g3_i1.p1  ORF type:complete len:741 (+),score=156.06 TRINITY_DN2235_c0_g3_i1:246-2468(+)